MSADTVARSRVGALGNKLWALFGLMILAVTATAPALAATTNYTYTTATNASLTDMSTGTTQLVAPASDDAASPLTNIGFDFYMLGVRYTQFSASSNGFIRLGGTAISTTNYALGTASTPLITPMGSDLETSSTGKVHFKVVGTAPNRVLVIEFLNATLIYDAALNGADGTSQVRLYENTGVIELVYGAMNRNASLGFQDGNDPQHIGFSFGSTAGNIASIDTNNVLSTAGTTPNLFPVSAPMASLNSATDGARRIYSFAPAVPTAPSALNFTAVTPLSMTLNWTDSPDETLYAVYRSTDGTNYSFLGTLAAGTTSFPATGLNPSTNYFWQIYAISDGAFSTALSGSQTTAAAGNITSTAVGGLWSAPGTWVSGVVPGAGDNVSIADGATVTIDTAAVALNLSVGSGGAASTLIYDAATARTLTLGQGLTISSTGSVLSAATGAITAHVLSVGSNLTNNGTLDLSTSADTAGATLTFAGAASNTFSGSGAVTDMRAITVAKGARENIIEVSPTNFTVRGVATDSAGFLTITSGTFKLSGSFTGSNRVFAIAGYTIPATGGFWLNNAGYMVAGQNGTGTVAGLFRLTQGTFNIGTSTGNSLAFSGGSAVIVEGGAVNSASRFGVSAAGNIFSYTQSAGTITVNTAGNAAATASFDLGTSSSSTVAISGGTIIVQLASTNATPRDYRNQAGSGITGVTNATLQLGNAASGAAKAYNIAGVVPNLVITNTSGNHTATFGTPATYNNISLNITLNTGNVLNFGNNVFLFNGTTLTNNGTLTHNGASSNFVWFTTTAPVLYTGAGVVTAPMTAFSVQADLGLTLDPASPSIVANAVRLFSGNVVNSNKLTVGNGGATAAVVQIGNTTTPTAAGTFDTPLVFNPGSGGISLSYLRTTGSRTTGGEVPSGTRTVNVLNYDDNDPAQTLTLAGGDLTVATTLGLVNGRFITGANTLIAGSATVNRTNAYVDGNFRKTVTAASARIFEVGTANGYSPVAFNVTGGTFPADITAKAVQTVAPSFTPASGAITRYWTLNATDITADLTFNYLDPLDLPGTVTEASLRVYRGTAGVYTDLGGTIDTAANTAVIAGVTTFSEWTLAMPAAGNLTITPALTDFGSQALSTTSAAQSVTLTNTGNASLDVTALTAAAAPFARTAGGTCAATLPITLAASASCTLTYTFTPTVVGLATQAFTVTATAPGATGFTLQGTGLGAAVLTVTPTTVAFGNQAVGVASAEQTVTLGNSGGSPLTVSALTAAAAPFARTGTGTCSAVPITINAGASCTLTFTFTPTATGAASQNLAVNAGAAGSNSIALSGTGVQGVLSITPTSVNFGSVNVGSTSAAQSVTLANTGTAPLSITALTAANAPFARTGSGTCSGSLPFTIAVGANCTLQYTFTPTAGGAATQSISVTGNGTGNGSFSLNGTGTTVDAIFANGFENP